MEIWERELKNNLGSAVVDKYKAVINEIRGVPRYVSEYLLGFFCEEGITEESLKELYEYVSEHKVDSREKEKFKHILLMDGELKIIDKFKVKIDLKTRKVMTVIPSLGINDAGISDEVLKENERLLIDGLWGMGKLEMIEDNKIELSEFKSFQLPDIELDELIEARKIFSSEEWLNIMISTMGLNNELYTRREKMILLSRLIPMVQDNIFLMEFGKPGTGKTYVYENISSYSRVISGSKISAPQLFYNLASKQDGLLVQYDVLLFDEIDKILKSGIDEDIINKLYQYLASGKFDRGDVEKISECGIMMVGNLPRGKFEKENLLQKLLHSSMTKQPFLDRLAGVVPGWELESLQDPKKAYTKNYGFSADYFSEILHKLRKKDHSYIKTRYDLKNCKIRDIDAIEKILFGLIKLMYPDGEITDRELDEILSLAVEYRQFVIDQNYNINKDPSLLKRISYEIL